MEAPYHIPVMLRRTVEMLVTNRAGSYADGTLGGGGHSAAILDAIRGSGVLYAFDADPVAIAGARERFHDDLGKSIVIRQVYFSEGARMLEEEGRMIDGVLLDLGVSSRQLDSDQIGLSYRQEMPLDMRFDPAADRRSAADIVNTDDAGTIATLLRTYGEEPAAWTIAQAIVRGRQGRRITTTTDLRRIIEATIPERFHIKTLSRVFQALRIAVNDELGELARALDRFVALLNPGGRFVVLTYHSLEDRMVKEKFREEERTCICPPEMPICQCDKERRLRIVTRKPIVPDDDEIRTNPRARSAKLRVAERVIDERRRARPEDR